MDRRRMISLAVLTVFTCAYGAESKSPLKDFGSAVNVESLKGYTLIELKTIHFLGRTTSSAQEQALLVKLARQWPKQAVIEVQGYAHGSSSPSENRALSATRAEFVAELLRNNGILPERILVIGLGEFDPAGSLLKPEHQRVDVRVFVESPDKP
jgi:outer membrane protein OmpA-like peptidoglycan-associated protein